MMPILSLYDMMVVTLRVVKVEEMGTILNAE